MYRFLLTRQWVILTLITLVLIPVMIKLGFWQLHRHEAKVAHNQLIASSINAPPEPVTRLSGVGREPKDDDQFRTVSATGRYDTAHESVVRQRTAADEQTIGYYVLTPLIQKDGTAVLVNRGWIEADGDLTKFPKTPAPPKGEVTVTGRMMADETSAQSGIKDKGDLPPRQVMLINSKQQTRMLHRDVVGGYVQLTDTSPKPQGKQPEKVPEPEHDSIGPHMAYAVQWWLFAAAVPVGWVVLARRERRDRLEAAARGAESAGDGAGGSPAPESSTPGLVPEPASGENADPVQAPEAEPAEEPREQQPAQEQPTPEQQPEQEQPAQEQTGQEQTEQPAQDDAPAPAERLSMADLTSLTRTGGPSRGGRPPQRGGRPGRPNPPKNTSR